MDNRNALAMLDCYKECEAARARIINASNTAFEKAQAFDDDPANCDKIAPKFDLADFGVHPDDEVKSKLMLVNPIGMVAYIRDISFISRYFISNRSSQAARFNSASDSRLKYLDTIMARWLADDVAMKTRDTVTHDAHVGAGGAWNMFG